jgi:hypothetical protein
MARPQKQAQTDVRGWLSTARVAALSTVIGSIYDQMLLAFNRSLDNLASHDQEEVADESGVVHQVADAVNAMQDAGRVAIQRTSIIGHPSQAEIEQAVQNALQRLGMPSRERVEKISHELDELNDLLEQQLASRRAVRAKAEKIEVKS